MPSLFTFFFFNDTATTEIYTLSLHDALPIFQSVSPSWIGQVGSGHWTAPFTQEALRSEEHTSELQSQSNLVCRLLLEKKKGIILVPPSFNITQNAMCVNLGKNMQT